MHLLYICETIDYGVGQNVLDLVDLSLAQGHRVTLIWSRARSGLQYQRWIAGVGSERFHALEIPMERSPGPGDLGVLWRTLGVIRNSPQSIDLIHGFSSKGGAIARLAGMLTGLPRFYSPHAYILSDPDLSRPARAFYFLVEKFLNVGANVVCTSREEVGLTQQLGARRFRFIANGIELPEPSGSRLRLSMTLPVRLAFVGRFCDQKNPLLFLRIAQALQDLPVEFHMFGDGELMEAVRAAVPQVIEGRLRLHGRVSLDMLWENMDVMVCTSRYEGFPYSFIQAIANGVPLVSTDVGGVDSIVDQGINGLVYSESDLGAVHEFIGKFARDVQFRSQVVAACKRKSLLFSREHMHRQMMDFYQEAMGQ
jgi:glycosyltransferase involved in cell wall biosynthesis